MLAKNRCSVSIVIQLLSRRQSACSLSYPHILYCDKKEVMFILPSFSSSLHINWKQHFKLQVCRKKNTFLIHFFYFPSAHHADNWRTFGIPSNDVIATVMWLLNFALHGCYRKMLCDNSNELQSNLLYPKLISMNKNKIDLFTFVYYIYKDSSVS